jgi:hypothetical protein
MIRDAIKSALHTVLYVTLTGLGLVWLTEKRRTR